jgi:hypothetical protein
MLLNRSLKFWWQRRTRGWDDSETWNLDTTICEFVLPRLKIFADNLHSYPGDLTPEDWDVVLAQIIQAMQIIVDEGGYPFDKDEIEIVERGMDLFRKYFFALWD